MRHLIRCFAPITLVVIAACSESPTGPVPTAPAGPSFDVGAPPASGQVVRIDSAFSILLTDPERGLTAYFGRDIVAWCQGDPAAADTVAYHSVTNPVETQRILRNVAGDVRTSVWLDGPNTCARYLSETPIATGLSHIRYTDNDIMPNQRPDPANHDAWGWMAQGELADAAGNRVHLTAISRAVFDGVDWRTTKQHVDILLH